MNEETRRAWDERKGDALRRIADIDNRIALLRAELDQTEKERAKAAQDVGVYFISTVKSSDRVVVGERLFTIEVDPEVARTRGPADAYSFGRHRVTHEPIQVIG